MSTDLAYGSIEGVADRIGSRVRESIIGRLDLIEECCESPIEVSLACELLDLFEPNNPIDTHFFYGRDVSLDDSLKTFGEWLEHSMAWQAYGPRSRVGIFSQVRLWNTRVDFLLLGHDVGIHGNEHEAMMVIECDGHDFHERTKEQAAKDRARDRNLSKHRIPFMRFTGSEIYRDSYKCMMEVEALFWTELTGIKTCPFRRDDVTES